MASAARRVEAEYYIPHLAHAPMEPPAATARIAQGKCEVWGCFQSPQAARDRVAKHIKNTYLKRVDAPVGVKAVLRCWMELNEG